VSDAFDAVGVYSGNLITVKNSFEAGTVMVNGLTKGNGYTYLASSGASQTYQAIPQYYAPYNRVWNTSGAPASISNWNRQESGKSPLPIIGATNISYPFIASLSDDQATYIAGLMKQYNLTLSTGYRDGANSGTYKVNGSSVGIGYASTIVQGNNATLEAIPNNGDLFVQWSDAITANPRVISPTDNTPLNAKYKGVHLSDNSSTFSNSQRKLVRTPTNGWLHQVYESMGHVWYEMSKDNGVTWTLMSPTNIVVNGVVQLGAPGPLDVGSGKCPAIAYSPNDLSSIVIVYQQISGTNYQIMDITYMMSSNSQGMIVQTAPEYPLWTEPTTVNQPGDQYATTNANPTIVWGSNGSGLLTWERKSSVSNSSPGINYYVASMKVGGGLFGTTSLFAYIDETKTGIMK
jgi:hypothetical protein